MSGCDPAAPSRRVIASMTERQQDGAGEQDRGAVKRAAMRGETEPRPKPVPRVRPIRGAEEAAAAEEAASSAAEPPANGERDERLKQAVDTARRQAEERATAEILALEEDLEKERERSARSLEEVQRRLEEAEARAADNVTVTDAREREDAASWLREQRGDVQRELESEIERRVLAREKE